MDNPTFTVADLAKRWNLHEITLRRKLESGKLPGFKIGNTWRITAAVVSAVEQNTLHID